MATENIDIDYTKYDFKDSTEMYVHLSKKGLSKETVIEISKMKKNHNGCLISEFVHTKYLWKNQCQLGVVILV